MPHRDILNRISSSLRHIAPDTFLFEAEQIILSILKCSRSDLYLGTTDISSCQISDIDNLVQRRLSGEPLGYVLGKVHFHTVDIHLSPSTLIPRPETEMLVEYVLLSEPTAPRIFFDMGTGSGAITAALLLQRINWRAVAGDLSLKALQTALQNITGHCACLCADCFTSFRENIRFDFIVSNPPYIPEKEYKLLDRQVLDFEPRMALDGGIDGLHFYRILATQAKKHLKPGHRLYCEIGNEQKGAVSELFSKTGWSKITVENDLTRRPRVFSAVFQ